MDSGKGQLVNVTKYYLTRELDENLTKKDIYISKASQLFFQSMCEEIIASFIKSIKFPTTEINILQVQGWINEKCLCKELIQLIDSRYSKYDKYEEPMNERSILNTKDDDMNSDLAISKDESLGIKMSTFTIPYNLSSSTIIHRIHFNALQVNSSLKELPIISERVILYFWLMFDCLLLWCFNQLLIETSLKAVTFNDCNDYFDKIFTSINVRGRILLSPIMNLNMLMKNCSSATEKVKLEKMMDNLQKIDIEDLFKDPRKQIEDVVRKTKKEEVESKPVVQKSNVTIEDKEPSKSEGLASEISQTTTVIPKTKDNRLSVMSTNSITSNSSKEKSECFSLAEFLSLDVDSVENYYKSAETQSHDGKTHTKYNFKKIFAWPKVKKREKENVLLHRASSALKLNKVENDADNDYDVCQFYKEEIESLKEENSKLKTRVHYFENLCINTQITKDKTIQKLEKEKKDLISALATIASEINKQNA